MSLKKSSIYLSIIIFAIANGLLFAIPVEAITQDFRWTGLAGYSVRGTLDYDETTNTKIIAKKGAERTVSLKSLTVTFYTPAGEAIDRYENVVDGEIKGNYFEVNIDPKTQQLFGNLDLGGEKAGEIFLKGTVDRQLSLVKIAPSGKEYLLDSDREKIN